MSIERVSIRVLPDGRISAGDAARTLGLAPKTLANWRSRGGGPSSFRVSGRRYYWFDEVVSFRLDDSLPGARPADPERSAPRPAKTKTPSHSKDEPDEN